MLTEAIELQDFGGRDYQPLLSGLADTPLQPWAQAVQQQLEQNLSVARYGDLPRWQQALSELPDIHTDRVELCDNIVQAVSSQPLDAALTDRLRATLQALHPWRKGPFNLHGVQIDTEWRSDMKWDRLLPAIEPLQGRTVLDVGCGSGYHCWRMAGEGAALTIGIEPSPLFVMQYWAVQRYMRNPRVWVVPQRIEQLPEAMRVFDSVFSMGILYHRRSPFEHLVALRDALRPGGQLILETLVIEGKEGECLVPQGRYAKMGNVWFIPTPASLLLWLKKVRFQNVQLVDVALTSKAEQRSTDWMRFESLPDFLDPQDSSKTVEGYPAPRRAIFTATAPG